MKSYNVAVIGGDGTGPEVVREAVKVLDAIERLERSKLIERKVESEEGNVFTKRHIFYRPIAGAQVPWATPQIRRHEVQNV